MTRASPVRPRRQSSRSSFSHHKLQRARHHLKYDWVIADQFSIDGEPHHWSLRGTSSKRYFPNTFFTSPTLFCTLPATFSVVPRSRRSGLPIAFPASSLTFPLASWIRPLILSFVLEFIHLIRASHRVGAGLSVNM